MAASRVIQSTGADGLTGAQRNQLATDRQIRQQRETNDAANKLAQIEAQNQGQRDSTFLNQVGANTRQGMADAAGLQQTQIKETAETGRNKVTNDAAMSRLVTGHGQTMEQLAKADQYNTAGDHRKLAATALAAGVPGAQLNQAMNAQPGVPVDYKGVQVPVRNSQQDQYQFVEQDMGPGQPKSIVVGNRQTGTIAPAVSALATGQQPQPQPQQQPATTGATPAAPDAFSKVYQANPQRLQEDAEFAASQIGTVYKTDEEQLSYLNSVRKTNPTLFQALKLRLGQQQPAAR